MLQRILTSVGRLAPSSESRIAALLVAGVFMPPFLQVLVQGLWLGYLLWNRRGDQERGDQERSNQQVSFLSPTLSSNTFNDLKSVLATSNSSNFFSGSNPFKDLIFVPDRFNFFKFVSLLSASSSSMPVLDKSSSSNVTKPAMGK